MVSLLCRENMFILYFVFLDDSVLQNVGTSKHSGRLWLHTEQFLVCTNTGLVHVPHFWLIMKLTNSYMILISPQQNPLSVLILTTKWYLYSPFEFFVTLCSLWGSSYRVFINSTPSFQSTEFNRKNKYDPLIFSCVCSKCTAQFKGRFPELYKVRAQISAPFEWSKVTPPSLRPAALVVLYSGRLIVDEMKSLVRLTCWLSEEGADLIHFVSWRICEIHFQSSKCNPWSSSSEACTKFMPNIADQFCLKSIFIPNAPKCMALRPRALISQLFSCERLWAEKEYHMP